MAEPLSTIEKEPAAASAAALVDPRVSRTKFDKEIAQFRAKEPEHLERGCILVRTEFPDTLMLFAQPKIVPSPIVFAVRINFENYDFWAPSITFIHPFSLVPLKANELPTQFLKKYPRKEAVEVPNGLPPGLMQSLPDIRPLLQTHSDQRPFLCVRGVREYHQHPQHTNDPWLAHRGTGVGTLEHIVSVLHRHGVGPIRQYGLQMRFSVVFGDIEIQNIPE